MQPVTPCAQDNYEDSRVAVQDVVQGQVLQAQRGPQCSNCLKLQDVVQAGGGG
jgi:hypothetical protein